uniref:Integumentary mucin C.1-like n=1 Tax=Acrobeloides nanus TaxID=290746 RepID=A0A914CI45_9BILA
MFKLILLFLHILVNAVSIDACLATGRQRQIAVPAKRITTTSKPTTTTIQPTTTTTIQPTTTTTIQPTTTTTVPQSTTTSTSTTSELFFKLQISSEK